MKSSEVDPDCFSSFPLRSWALLRGMGALQSLPGQPEYVDLAEKTGCEYTRVNCLRRPVLFFYLF